MWIGLYKILFHFEALLHKTIFCEHPLYCAIYYTILIVIAPPRPILKCFSGVWRCFWSFFLFYLVFSGRILDGWRCLKKKRSRHGKGGIIAHNNYLCNTAIPRSQPPFIAYNIAQYIFPTPPFIIAIKYWQYLVRANMWSYWLLAIAIGWRKFTTVSTSRLCRASSTGIGIALSGRCPSGDNPPYEPSAAQGIKWKIHPRPSGRKEARAEPNTWDGDC